MPQERQEGRLSLVNVPMVNIIFNQTDNWLNLKKIKLEFRPLLTWEKTTGPQQIERSQVGKTYFPTENCTYQKIRVSLLVELTDTAEQKSGDGVLLGYYRHEFSNRHFSKNLLFQL